MMGRHEAGRIRQLRQQRHRHTWANIHWYGPGGIVAIRRCMDCMKITGETHGRAPLRKEPASPLSLRWTELGAIVDEVPRHIPTPKGHSMSTFGEAALFLILADGDHDLALKAYDLAQDRDVYGTEYTPAEAIAFAEECIRQILNQPWRYGYRPPKQTGSVIPMTWIAGDVRAFYEPPTDALS